MSDASGVSESRLRWQCRRGMRELDQVLGWYLDNRYADADVAQKQAFSTMLECQDPDLWEWLSGRRAPEHPEWQHIVDAIRTRNNI